MVRWIHLHPKLHLTQVYSRSNAGLNYADVVPEFQGFVSLTLSAIPDRFTEVDVLFLATAHGAAASLVPKISGVDTVVDLSRDHRHVSGWVYAQPEWLGKTLPGAKRILPRLLASHCAGFVPLTTSKQLIGPIVCVQLPVHQSGVSPTRTTHHPERFSNIRAYKVLNHQHVSEIQGFLSVLGNAPHIDFVPLSAPIDRGIFATVFADVAPGFNLKSAFVKAYRDAPLVRLREQSPDLRMLRGTAFADIALYQEGGTAVVLVAIDNLGKGAAAQAIQALNLAKGFSETEGLSLPSYSP